MFVTDQPIKSIEEDILGRGDFIRSLARAIIKHPQIESFVIGLYGGWGFGKTSIINMAAEHIDFVSKSTDHASPVIVRFNPWNYSDHNQITFQFLRQMSFTLKESGNPDLDNAGNCLLEMAGIFHPVTISNDLYTRDLSSIQRKISAILDKIDFKIITIIDDVDRLNFTEIRQIFQAVKTLANFPNTVYILSFNKDVILKTLDDNLKGCSGADYLEDIIQVPFVIPTIPEKRINNLLNSGIEDIVSDDIQYYNKEYWEMLYNSGLAGLFKDIRVINRYLNVLKFDYELVRRDVNIAEFLAITALQVFEPVAYDEIKNNKELFCFGRIANKTLSTEAIDRLTRNTFNAIIDKREKLSEDELKDILSWLFPEMMDITGIIKPEMALKEFKIDPTISDTGHFETYFKSSMLDTKISAKKISGLISVAGDIEVFKEKLLKLDDFEIEDFLDRLVSPDQYSILSKFLSDISHQELSNLVSVVAGCGDSLYNDRLIDISKINSVLLHFLHKIDNNDERYNMLKQAITCSNDNLHTSSHLVYNCIVERLIHNQEHIYDLRETIKTKIETYDKFYKHENLALILINLKKLGYRNQVNLYVEKLKQSTEGFLHLMSTFINEGERLKGFSIRPDNIKVLLTLGEVDERLREIIPIIEFDKLDDHKKYVISRIASIVKSTRLSKPDRAV